MQQNFQHAMEIADLEHDIQEIEQFLSSPFDRAKSIYIIEKHHFTDWNIAISDLLLQVNLNTLSVAPPHKIRNYINVIEIYLISKLENLRSTRSAV